MEKLYDYRKESYEMCYVRRLKESGNEVYRLWLDASNHYLGVIRFAHAMNLQIQTDEENRVSLLKAWEENCSASWSYSEEDAERFEDDHPGLLKSIEESIRLGKVILSGKAPKRVFAKLGVA